jgi:hypothetical protein
MEWHVPELCARVRGLDWSSVMRDASVQAGSGSGSGVELRRQDGQNGQGWAGWAGRAGLARREPRGGVARARPGDGLFRDRRGE